MKWSKGTLALQVYLTPCILSPCTGAQYLCNYKLFKHKHSLDIVKGT